MSSVTSAAEIERKYDVDDGVPLPALAGYRTERREPVTQVSIYFDTADAALARRGGALRRREGGHDDGWHVKLPAARGRTEYQAPLAVEPPGDLLAVIRAVVRDHPLVEIARLTTRRTVTLVLAEDGAPVAEIADDHCEGSDVTDGRVTVWREWEVELLSAAPTDPIESEALLDLVGEQLISAGAVPSSSGSKLGRTLQANPRSLALTAARPWTGGPDAALAPVLATIGALLERLIVLDRAVRSDDPDAVHDLRTALRRLRALLAGSRGILDGSVTDPIRSRLGAAARVLGPARDAEVRRITADALLADQDPDLDSEERTALRRISDDAATEFATGRDSAITHLDSIDWLRLLDDIESLVTRPPLASRALQPVRRTLRSALKRQSKRASRRIRRSRDEVTGPDVHEVRKAVRRVRYLAELLTEGPDAVFGKKVRRLAKTAATVQRAIGLHRDATLFAEHLALLSREARAAGSDTAALAQLGRRQRERADAALAELGKLERAYSAARDEL